MGYMGDSLPVVDSYFWYTPCFLPVGSIKVHPKDVLIQFYDIFWAMGDSLPGVDSYSWYTPCFLPIESIKVHPQDVLIQFYDILWAVWATPCQELTHTLGILLVFSLLEVLRSGLRMY